MSVDKRPSFKLTLITEGSYFMAWFTTWGHNMGFLKNLFRELLCGAEPHPAFRVLSTPSKLQMLQISLCGYGDCDKPLIHTMFNCLCDTIQLLLPKYKKLDFTLQPVPQVVQPHAGQLSIVFFQHIVDRVEPLVELV